jgi:CheY-like chemotaxis protein
MNGTRKAALPPVKFLLVDDLEDNLLALSALLRDLDVEILVARSGQEALELLLQHDVALALLDVQMPEMDGFELAELMRGAERTRHVPIIFVTAGVRDSHRHFRGYEKWPKRCASTRCSPPCWGTTCATRSAPLLPPPMCCGKARTSWRATWASACSAAVVAWRG